MPQEVIDRVNETLDQHQEEGEKIVFEKLPPEVLDIINAALAQYQGDSKQIAQAKQWIADAYVPMVKLETEELAELKEAIAASEEEERLGIYYTLEDIESDFAEGMAQHKMKKQEVKA